MGIERDFDKLERAIMERNFSMLTEVSWDITSICRRSILDYEKDVLDKLYGRLSNVIVSFSRTGESEWPAADRIIGGLESMKGFIGDVLQAPSSENLINEIDQESVEASILRLLAKIRISVSTKELSLHLKKDQEIIRSKLAGFERMGVVIKSCTGENPMVHLSPKGEKIAAAFM